MIYAKNHPFQLCPKPFNRICIIVTVHILLCTVINYGMSIL